MAITLRVKDVMDDKVFYINEDATVMEVLSVMVDKNVWSIVISRSSLPIGVITERDILRRVIHKGYDINKIKAKDIMSSPLITINPNAAIGEALTMMAEKSIRRIYLIEDGKIKGRITQTEILKNMLNVMRTLASLPHQL